MLPKLTSSNFIHDEIVPRKHLFICVRIYLFSHDPKKIDEKDSIPFQLQKLFVNLQTSGKSCHTRDLLKSFQWTEAQAFQQHDVQ